MTNTDLFANHPDWLSHTLANAGLTTAVSDVALPDGGRLKRLATGVLCVHPAQVSGPHTILSAGVHGNETAPIEILNALVQSLLEGNLTATCPTLLILGNPPAMVTEQRFVTYNMNRLFSGAHQHPDYRTCYETERAAQLEQFCLAFTEGAERLVHYDLHTAIRPSHREKFALYPWVPDRTITGDQCRFLLDADVDTLLLQHTGATTFSAFTAVDLGGESLTVELGKVRPFGENNPEEFRGIDQALRRHLRGEPAPATGRKLTRFEVVHEIIHTGDHFHFHVSDDTPNFTEFPPGTIIWEDRTTEYRVGDQPEAIVFPNPSVPKGHRVGLMVREVKA